VRSSLFGLSLLFLVNLINLSEVRRISQRCQSEPIPSPALRDLVDLLDVLLKLKFGLLVAIDVSCLPGRTYLLRGKEKAA
jgi:hypothetical protein